MRSEADAHERDPYTASSRKMEAIGRLAGGIAHDFSNLLTVILGASEHLLNGLPAEDPLWQEAESIRTSALRAVAMTRQLLAFSRQQASEPTVLSVNDVIATAEPLLRRLIGEDVELATSFSPDVGFVRADASQLEQVLLNLAVNARDAMPSGGTLTIETRRVSIDRDCAGLELPPGRYSVLHVRDTGVGMDAETRARAFEPFFTTKERGRGTGLGLATVYGIVRESGGSVHVESSPGAGTEMRVFLPSVPEPLTSPVIVAPPAASVPGGNETVLVVEDEDGVRELVGEMLEAVGYQVLSAGRPAGAVQACQDFAGTIDLLLTDVVMPEMNGLELARRIRAVKPATRVLFMSGYPEHTALAGGSLEHGMQLLAKPFDRQTLLRSVRAALDAASADPA
jgi:nitrogen-specific signal transduction histidine kinase/ActR/RegA family two-component response regulator